MPNTEKIIETKVKAFAKDISKFLSDKRAAKIATLTKAGDAEADKKLVKVRFKYSSGKGSILRSPEQQAIYVSDGTSWTCAGSHMVDKARHVLMMYAPAGKKEKASWKLSEAFGSKDHHFVTLSDLKKKWKTLMSTHGLKNHKGGDGMGGGDEFHFELPDSKVPHSDKRVQACLVHYAKITRLEGRKKNSKFEGGSWKTSLKPHLQAAEKEKQKLDDAERIAELKKLQFDGSAVGKQTLMSGASKSGTSVGKPFPDIDVPGPYDTGAAKTKKVTSGNAFVWDSLARSIFEKLGLAETKGFDVKLSCGIDYNIVTYENLSQTFLTGLTPKCVLVYNTPVARAMGMSVSVASNVKLAKSGSEPAGTVVFTFEMKSPTDTEKGTITFDIKGATVKATTKVK